MDNINRVFGDVPDWLRRIMEDCLGQCVDFDPVERGMIVKSDGLKLRVLGSVEEGSAAAQNGEPVSGEILTGEIGGGHQLFLESLGERR